MKKAVLSLALLLLGAGGGLLYVSSNRAAPSGAPPATPSGAPAPVAVAKTPEHGTGPAAFCGKHQRAEADCPWCDPRLIKSKGQCGGHGVPEALCSRCDDSLIAGFKAEGDWCAGHNLPESQCARCKGGDLPPGEREAQ